MKYFLSFITIFLSLFIFSQENIKEGKYHFKIKGSSEGEVFYIGYYLADKQYIKDTLMTNNQGEFTFKAEDIHPGVYLLVSGDDKSYLEFLVDEPNFTMVTTKEKKIKDVDFIGSRQNEAFYNYLNFIADKKQEGEKIKENKTLSETEQQAKQDDLSKQVESHQNKLIAQFKNDLLGNLIRASQEVEPDTPPSNLSDKDKQLFAFNSYKRKYFNNVDFSKNYLIYTPLLFKKIEVYLEKLTYNIPDSNIVSCDYLLEKASQNEENFKLVLIHLVNKYAKTKKVCFDKVYVHLVENYYKKGKAPWAEKETIEKMVENAVSLKNVLCGSKFPSLVLNSLMDKEINLHNITSDYKVVVFIDPDCSTCKKTLNELKELELPENKKDKTLKVITVQHNLNNDPSEIEEIKKLFKEKGYNQFINLIDPLKKYDWEMNFNVKSTPTVFLLNKDNEIIYKRIDVSQIQEILKNI